MSNCLKGEYRKLLRCLKNNEIHIGLKQETSILDLTTYAENCGMKLPSTIEEIPIISQVEDINCKFIEKPDGKYTNKEDNLTFLPIISAPEKIIRVSQIT